MVLHFKTFINKGCKIAAQKKFIFGRILQGSGGYSTGIRRLYNKDQEVYKKDQEVMFSDTIIEHSRKLLIIKGVKLPLQKKSFFSLNFALLAGFFWYQCYYAHRSRDTLSPVCRIYI